MDKMKIYNQLKTTDKEAQKKITGGRLNGFTDINPMFRIKKLTEVFGMYGEGWYFEILNKQIVNGGTIVNDKGTFTEQKAFVDILLFVKLENGEWSKGAFGTGGASFVSNEKGGQYTNDECFKMALTDAIGGACKLFGMSADIYYAQDNTKYPTQDIEEDAFEKRITKEESKAIVQKSKEKWGADAPEKCCEILTRYGANNTLSLLQIYYENVMKDIEAAQ